MTDRIIIDEHGKIRELVCCECSRTPANGGDFCERCSERHSHKFPSHATVRPGVPAWVDPRDMARLQSQWMDEACQLLFHVRRAFEVRQNDDPPLDVCGWTLGLCVRMAALSAVPWPAFGHHRVVLAQWWSREPRLYELAYSTLTMDRDDLPGLVAELQEWYWSHVRQSEMEDAHFQERN